MSDVAKPSVLFVCLGNICRSPLAEGVMRARSATAGLPLFVDSAGTGDWHIGRPPDPRSIAVARAAGIDISGRRARQVTARDFLEFSHMVAMDRSNMADLRRLSPAGSEAALSLLLDHTGCAPGDRDVPDPYYGGPEGFEHCLALVEAGIAGLIERLRDQSSG